MNVTNLGPLMELPLHFGQSPTEMALAAVAALQWAELSCMSSSGCSRMRPSRCSVWPAARHSCTDRLLAIDRASARHERTRVAEIWSHALSKTLRSVIRPAWPIASRAAQASVSRGSRDGMR